MSPDAFEMRIFGLVRVARKMKALEQRITRMNTLGVKRVGTFLLNEKKNKCKMGLYSGQEVAPNKYRYGWEHLGGPAVYHFTKSVLNSHKLVFIGTDKVQVELDAGIAPHASMIHGPIDRMSGHFYNARIDAHVRQRPWMKATREEKETILQILTYTYRGRTVYNYPGN